MQKLAFILAAFIISIMARAEDGTHDRRLVQSKQTLEGLILQGHSIALNLSIKRESLSLILIWKKQTKT